MRIRAHIFGWVFLATIVPLTAMALAATYYAENDYEQGVRESVTTSLNTLGSELQRRLYAQRNLAMGLARANAVQEFLPIMLKVERGEVDPRYEEYRDRINHYFEGFQTILDGMYIMRLMDRSGNSFIKVSEKKLSEPVYESISGVKFVEQEVDARLFRSRLEAMPRNDVTMTVLAHNEQQTELMSILPLLDYVVPLYEQNRLVGGLSLTLFGETIDSILSHAPRLYKARLFVAENNPDNPDRHGMLLFDDEQQIHLAQIRSSIDRFQDIYASELLDEISDKPAGIHELREDSIFYLEIYPYANQLTSWIIGMRIGDAEITEPFQQIRWAIWSIAGIALLFSLLLGDIGVRTIARPLRALSRNLLSYAQGQHSQRVSTNAPVDEIQDLERAFNTMADSLDRASQERDRAQHMMLQNSKLASIGQMAAGIGHEINNPLNNILSYTKLIERNIDDQDTRALADLKALREEALRASDIIRGILNFGRQVAPQYAPFGLEQWLQDTLNLVRQSAKTAGINLACHPVEDLTIEGDRGQLQQALINLLINAIQASPRDSEVSVFVSHDDHNVTISITDQGRGIADDIIDKVFDPFYTTKPEGEGSGLGLSISLGIIERHHGKLMIRNNPLGGVTATMVIPRTERGESGNG